MRGLLNIKTRGRQYLYNRHMLGPGYRKQCIRLLGKALQDMSHHITMPSRCGTAGMGKRQACLGLPDVFDLERGQGNQTPSPGAELRQEDRLRGSGSVVS